MTLIFIFLRILRFFFGFIFKPIVNLAFKIYYRNEDKSNPLPKIKNSILLLPANKLARKIRDKELKSTQVVQAYIDRINEVQPFLNCVVFNLFTEAIEEAKEVDAILALNEIPEKYSEANAPLLGVPYSCKECIWVKGCPNATGLVSRKEFRAPESADVVKLMKESGAILTCLTNTSELCMWFESSNYLYGTTRNPYNLSRIVGGSSGGEGCIVGSAASVFGIGSDIGGSIRMPAYFNGVYGHKPTSNFISNHYQHPPAEGLQQNMLATGPICRYATDLKLVFKILAGPRYKEIANNFENYTDLKKLKFYYIKDLQGNLLGSDLSSNTKNAFKKAITFFEKSLGVEVKELHVPKLKSIVQIWASLMNNGESYKDSFKKLMINNDEKNRVNVLIEILKTLFGFQKKHTLPALALSLVEGFPLHNTKHNIELGEKIKNELKIILGNDGIVFFPSFPVVAPYHSQPLLTNPLDWIYYGTFNALGFPVTQVPLGLSKRENLPTGIQIVANHMCDHLTIKTAEYIEENLIGWVQP